MNIFDFARSKRSGNAPSNDDLNTIFEDIPELTDNKLQNSIVESVQYDSNGVLTLPDSKFEDLTKCVAGICFNVGLLSGYLSEDSKDIIDQLLEGKLVDPLVQCVALSAIGQLNTLDVDVKSIFVVINECLSKDSHSDIHRQAWTLVKKQIKSLTDIDIDI
jgi:hypothetical protein